MVLSQVTGNCWGHHCRVCATFIGKDSNKSVFRLMFFQSRFSFFDAFLILKIGLFTYRIDNALHRSGRMQAKCLLFRFNLLKSIFEVERPFTFWFLSNIFKFFETHTQLTFSYFKSQTLKVHTGLFGVVAGMVFPTFVADHGCVSSPPNMMIHIALD